MLSTQATIGNLKINVQGRDLRELIEQSSVLFECPQECGLCRSKNLGLRFRVAGSYEFYELKCLDCEGTFSFGQQKKENGGGLFPRGSQDKGHEGEWDKKYERDDHREDDRRGGGRNDRGRDDRRGDDRGRGNDRRDDRRGGGRNDELNEDSPY